MKHARKDYDERIQDSAGLIPDDEPVLLIRGQDACALAAGQAWIDRARELHADPAIIESIELHMERVELWQIANGNKVPDAPDGVLDSVI